MTVDLKGATNELDALLMDGSIGDKIIVEVVEMTEEEFNNLPEFMGW